MPPKVSISITTCFNVTDMLWYRIRIVLIYMAIGRIPNSSPKATAASTAAAQSRLNRRNKAKQVQAQKRNVLSSAIRIFNGVDGAPRIVAIIPLSGDLNARASVASLAESLDLSVDDCPETGLWKIKYVLVHCFLDTNV
jgi:pre-rRNA-processing protein TSR1